MEKQMDIKDDEEYAIRSKTKEEKDQDNGELIPNYKIKMNLSEDEQAELTKQVFLEFDALKTEREKLKLTEKWEELDRQYDGKVTGSKDLMFNLHTNQSKIKTDAIVRAINEAFLDSKPMVDVSPRPESGRQDGFEVAEKQQQFVDYAMEEEIKPEIPFIKIAHSAATKFVGIGKVSWEYKRERRRREESYEGKIVPVDIAPDGQIIADNEGLRKFLTVYPDGMETHQGIIKRLLEEKKVELVVEFKDTINNNPKLKHIRVEDFYVRNSTDYWEGLRDTHIIVERQEYSYWDLMKKEENEEFENVDKLWVSCGDAEGSDDYMTKDYEVIEVTTYYKDNDGDEDIKIKAWFGEDRKVFLGAEIYPYYGFDIDYVPFYIKVNDDGFYGGAKSVLSDLRDSNIAQDALLNLALHGTYIRNILTPIIKEGSGMEDLFLDHMFQAGKPLVVDELTDDVNKAMGFVNWGNVDVNASLVLMEKLKRIDSDVSRVSDLTTGAESALDPTAPASKTLALLQQSGIGIKDYIRVFLPSFNVFVSMILQLYYQMSHEDKEYKVISKAGEVTGENPFAAISRDEMMTKTNVQSRAAAFAFDKMNEKREALAAYQTVMGDPYARQQPRLLYKALKTLLDTFGDRWQAISDTELASPEEFQQEMNMVAMQAIQALAQQAQQQAQITGVAPNQQAVAAAAPGAVQQAQAEAYSPELAAEREKQEG